MSQVKGQMGLDEREAELWNPQPWAQSTRREGKQERPHRHTHRLARQVESALRSRAAKHAFANQADAHRLITGRPGWSGAATRANRETDRQAKADQEQPDRTGGHRVQGLVLCAYLCPTLRGSPGPQASKLHSF